MGSYHSYGKPGFAALTSQVCFTLPDQLYKQILIPPHSNLFINMHPSKWGSNSSLDMLTRRTKAGWSSSHTSFLLPLPACGEWNVLSRHWPRWPLSLVRKSLISLLSDRETVCLCVRTESSTQGRRETRRVSWTTAVSPTVRRRSGRWAETPGWDCSLWLTSLQVGPPLSQTDRKHTLFGRASTLFHLI